MARLPRLVLPGIPHHVTQRGNRRERTFFEDGDYALYLDLLSDASRRTGVEIWSYCLMPNHVHIIAVPSDEDGLRRTFRYVHRHYTGFINALWESRFERGDPLAATARQFGWSREAMSKSVRIADNILRSAIQERIIDDSGLNSRYTRTIYNIPPGEYRSPYTTYLTDAGQKLLERIRVDYRIALGRYHADAIESDRQGVPHLLSRRQVTDYHHRALRDFRLPSSAFAGTWPFGGQSDALTNFFTKWGAGLDPVGR